MKKTLVFAAMMVVGTAGMALAQDAQKGEAVFRLCRPCHAIGPDATNMVGPQLNGLDGRHSGTAPDYPYSDANKNSGIVWAEATFKQYIKDPKALIPGTKMFFAGIKSQQQIDDLWAYLSQFNADGSLKKK